VKLLRAERGRSEKRNNIKREKIIEKTNTHKGTFSLILKTRISHSNEQLSRVTNNTFES